MKKGFSLLEVVVAMAIMALSLMAIFHLNSGAIANHAFTKRLTVATLLARGKMIDLEQKLHDKGLSVDDEEESGDFSDEGWPSYKWRAKVLAPRTQGMSPDKLIAAIFSIPTGAAEGDSSAMGLSALFTGGGAPPSGGQTGANGMLSALGPMATMVQGQFTQMIDQITKSVREVHLTVSWKIGDQVESFDLVTHVVSLGPNSDRNLWTPAGGGGAGPGGGQFVRQVDGRPVANPIPGPGGMVDPLDNSPVIPQSIWFSQQAARGGGPPPTMPFNMPGLAPFGKIGGPR